MNTNMKMNGASYVNQIVLARLQDGEIPWHRPWKPGYSGSWSRSTGQPYSALNQWILRHQGEYIGYKAACDLHADFRGLKLETVTWCSSVEKKTGVIDPTTGKEKIEKFFAYTIHKVIPVSLIPNLEPSVNPDAVLRPDARLSTGMESLVADYLSRSGVTVEFSDALKQPYFDGSSKTVRIFPVQRYESTEAYYADLFHLLVQSTGADDLLARKTDTPRQMARESLLSEMGSCMLCSTFEMDTQKVFDNSIAYIQRWTRLLSDDASAFVTCATAAEKAVRLILDIPAPTKADASVKS